jgi:hypothetical protein
MARKDLCKLAGRSERRRGQKPRTGRRGEAMNIRAPLLYLGRPRAILGPMRKAKPRKITGCTIPFPPDRGGGRGGEGGRVPGSDQMGRRAPMDQSYAHARAQGVSPSWPRAEHEGNGERTERYNKPAAHGSEAEKTVRGVRNATRPP